MDKKEPVKIIFDTDIGGGCDDAGVTTWYPNQNGQHTYLLPKEDYNTIRKIIDSLVMPERPANPPLC